MPYGYAGRILWIDLTSGEIREETPDDQFYRKYVGGRGIGAWTLLKNQSAGVDALGPATSSALPPACWSASCPARPAARS